MEYVPLGNTGLKVSRICLGCMSYRLVEMARLGFRGIGIAPVFSSVHTLAIVH